MTAAEIRSVCPELALGLADITDHFMFDALYGRACNTVGLTMAGYSRLLDHVDVHTTCPWKLHRALWLNAPPASRAPF